MVVAVEELDGTAGAEHVDLAAVDALVVELAEKGEVGSDSLIYPHGFGHLGGDLRPDQQ